MKEDLKSYPPISDCVVIDFMAFVYTLTSKSLQSEGKDVTFGHAANILLQKFLKMGANTNSIHIAFDIYNESSIKSDERTRRTGKKSAVIISITSELQKFPIDLKRFWCANTNKTNFQSFFY